MAQDATLNGLRSQIIKSLYGNKLGLSYGSSGSNSMDYLQGVAAVRNPISTAISSTASPSTIPPYGVTQFNMSGASGSTGGFNVQAPVPGVRKLLVNLSTQYVVVAVDGVTTGVTVLSTFGTTGARIYIPSRQNAEMIGLTTAVWQLIGNMGTSVGTTEFVGVNGDTAPTA